MRAINFTKNQIIAEKLECADTLFARMRGLLGRESMPAGSGMLIKSCKGIHTFCMKFPIDVIFLDKDNVVLSLEKRLPPNRLTRIYFRASSVLELPAGKIEDASTNIGDKINIY